MAELDDAEREVLDAVEAARETNLELLRDLVRSAPVNPPGDGGNEEQAAEVLRPVLDDLGFEVTEYTSIEGRPNLVVRLEGDGDGPTLLMNAHLDVVPVEDPGRVAERPVRSGDHRRQAVRTRYRRSQGADSRNAWRGTGATGCERYARWGPPVHIRLERGARRGPWDEPRPRRY